jgi:hypothetical protein
MTITAQEAARIAAMVQAARKTGSSASGAMTDIRIQYPNLTMPDVKKILDARFEEAGINVADVEAEANAAARMGALMEPAAVLSSNPDITTMEALVFFAERAQSGDEEAKALLATIDDPFLGA